MEELLNRYRQTVIRSSENFENSHSEIPSKTTPQKVHDWEDWSSAYFVDRTPDSAYAG